MSCKLFSTWPILAWWVRVCQHTAQILKTDASITDWGAVLEEQRCARTWSPKESQWPSNRAPWRNLPGLGGQHHRPVISELNGWDQIPLLLPVIWGDHNVLSTGISFFEWVICQAPTMLIETSPIRWQTISPRQVSGVVSRSWSYQASPSTVCGGRGVFNAWSARLHNQVYISQVKVI